MAEKPDKNDRCRVIAVVNQKGGVGKTTTTVNLATAIAAVGHRVLVVDADPQGNASTGFGIARADRHKGCYDLMFDGLAVEDVAVTTGIPDLSIITSSADLAGAEIQLVSIERREFRMREAFERSAKNYDFILIDCPPSLNLITLNALVAADALLVPLQVEFYALEGISNLLQTVEAVRMRFNPTLEIQGVVLTMYDKRNSLSDAVAADVRAYFKDRVYDTVIPRNVRVSEAPSYGKPVLLYDHKCPGSSAYIRLASEVLKREKRELPSGAEENLKSVKLHDRGNKNMNQTTKPAPLGRGLSALFGDADTSYQPRAVPAPSADEKGLAPRFMPIEWLHSGAFQPRHNFDEDAIKGLAESIRERGILQPLLVRPLGTKDSFEIIAGERRWRAAQLAGLHEVPVVVRELSDREALEFGLIENVQRQDLSALEEAEGYQRLMGEFQHTQEGLAKVIGKSRSHIANTIRLLTLPPAVKQLIERGLLSAGHARTLVTARNPLALAEEIVKKGLNVRQAEALAKREAENPQTHKKKPTSDANTTALEKDLSHAIGLKVNVTPHGKSGTVTLHYQDLEQLDAIIKKLKS